MQDITIEPNITRQTPNIEGAAVQGDEDYMQDITIQNITQPNITNITIQTRSMSKGGKVCRLQRKPTIIKSFKSLSLGKL